MNLLQRLLTTTLDERGLGWPLDAVPLGGRLYSLGLQQTLGGTREEIGTDFVSLATGALGTNPIVYAAMQARSALFSEARFIFRQRRSGRPGELFSKPSLDILTHPWPGGTTGDLLSVAINDLDLAGNAFILRRNGRLVRLRPDWTVIVYGSPQDSMWDVDAKLIGYSYQPGGPSGGRDWITFDPNEVAHFRGITQDPLAPHRGLGWVRSVVREIEADNAATTQKAAYYANGSTPNLVVSGITASSLQAFDDWVEKFKLKHQSAANAYKTLFLTTGTDAKVIGSDMLQGDLRAIQGADEVRISVASGVPATVLGLSEGLQGSSLNAGNFAQAMRRFADITMRPLWRNIAGSLEVIVPTPGDAELWYDDRDIPALKDDIKDAAEVAYLQAQTIRQYVDGGFEPDSVVESVNAGDLKRLSHTGKLSVQLQSPNKPEPEPATAPVEPVAPPPNGAKQPVATGE